MYGSASEVPEGVHDDALLRPREGRSLVEQCVRISWSREGKMYARLLQGLVVIYLSRRADNFLPQPDAWAGMPSLGRGSQVQPVILAYYPTIWALEFALPDAKSLFCVALTWSTFMMVIEHCLVYQVWFTRIWRGSWNSVRGAAHGGCYSSFY